MKVNFNLAWKKFQKEKYKEYPFYCKELDALHSSSWMDVIEKQGSFTCWFPVESEEYSADPLHAHWHIKFLEHKIGCYTCRKIYDNKP